MTAIAIIATYLAIGFLMWVHVYRWLYREHMQNFASLGWRDKDRSFAVLWGGTVSLFWPLFAPIFGVTALANRIARNDGGMFAWLERG